MLSEGTLPGSRWIRRIARLRQGLPRRPLALGSFLAVLAVPGAGALEAPAAPPAQVAALPAIDRPAPVSERSVADRAVARTAAAAARSAGAANGVIRPGESLARALTSRGVPPIMVQLIERKLGPLFDFRDARPGDHWSLRRTAGGSLLEFRYTRVTDDGFRLYRDGTEYVAERRDVEYVRRTARLAGVVSTTLYDAVRDLGESPQLASDFAEIFAYDVDFVRGLRPGDEFQMLYERLYRTDRSGHEAYVRPGRILAAHFEGASGDHTAVYYQVDEGHGGYFRPDGSPVERQFLVAPLKYSRVSSTYSHARLHPILGITRPHLGIDYAAPEGTPLWSVADGKVIFRGYENGFGNLVKIQHPNGYVSYYAHLSRFVSGLHVGESVRQKQVIGFVGMTGLATGPHVCFRIAKDGHYVNPASLHRGVPALAGVAVKGPFRAARDTLLSELRSSPLVAVGEAL